MVKKKQTIIRSPYYARHKLETCNILSWTKNAFYRSTSNRIDLYC